MKKKPPYFHYITGSKCVATKYGTRNIGKYFQRILACFRIELDEGSGDVKCSNQQSGF